MSNRPKIVAAVAIAFAGFVGSASAQFNVPGLTPTDPSIISCASINGQTVRCPLPENQSAEYVRRTSNAPCTRGDSYVIGATEISVSKGCRAEFRLVERPLLSGSSLTTALRREIVTELSARLRADYRLGSSPPVELLTDDERFISSSEVGYSGKARVRLDADRSKTIAFDSVYGIRSRDFSNVTYRVVQGSDVPGSRPGENPEITQRMNEKINSAMREKMRVDMGGSAVAPRFEVLGGTPRNISSNEIGFTGQGRAMLDGNHWQPVEFESVYDIRYDTIRTLTYRLAGGNSGRPGGNIDWRPGVSMDENNQEAISAALAAEVRSQKGGGHVQIVINSRYQESPDGTGVVRYHGKFGYSFNDGSWVTRGFDATMSLTQNKVQHLDIFKLKTQ